MRHVAIIVLAVFVSVSAIAQNRTFVSSAGLDTNPCSRTAPCRSFGSAVTAVVAGGEVIVLDSAGYGVVSITKSVSLIAPAGVYAGVTVPAAPDTGILVNAPGGTVNVVGLSVTNAGGVDGIGLQDAAELHVERVVATGFDGAGLHTYPVLSPRLTVRDSAFRDSNDGIRVQGSTEGSIDHCRFDNNFAGVLVVDPGRTTIRDSVFFGAIFDLYVVPSAGVAEASIENCVFSSSDYGIYVQSANQGSAIVRFSNSSFLNLSFAGLAKAGTASGTLISFGNNQFNGNASDGTPDSTVALK